MNTINRFTSIIAQPVKKTIKKTPIITPFDPMKPRGNITIENRILSFLPADNQIYENWGIGCKANGKRYSKRLAGETPDSCHPPSLPPAKKRQRRQASSTPTPLRRAASKFLSKAFQRYLRSRQHEKIQADLKKWKKDWKKKARIGFRNGSLNLALGEYTTNYYRQINTALRARTEKKLERRLQGVITEAKRALAVGICSGNLKVCKKVLYRGTGILPFVPKVGATFCDKAFHSTTWKESVTHRFLNKFPVKDPRYLFVYTHHLHGVCIKEFSRLKNEEEVLFPPNSRFLVTSVLPGHKLEGVEGNVTRVELQEMENDNFLDATMMPDAVSSLYGQ